MRFDIYPDHEAESLIKQLARIFSSWLFKSIILPRDYRYSQGNLLGDKIDFDRPVLRQIIRKNLMQMHLVLEVCCVVRAQQWKNFANATKLAEWVQKAHTVLGIYE